MLTPQEVSERSFAKATFGGYNMVQVDEFLDILTRDYSALYSENAVLKSKMKVLVDKVDEYRSTEEAMRKALMSAQRMADDLVSEAQQKKENILQEAEADARRQVDELNKEIENQQFRLKKAQEATAGFISQVRALQGQHDALLNSLQDLCPEQEVPAADADPVDETAHEIDDNVQRLLAQAISDATAENLRAKEEEAPSPEDMRDTAEFPVVTAEDLAPQAKPEADEDDLSSATRINFGDLQFGRDYEIK